MITVRQNDLDLAHEHVAHFVAKIKDATHSVSFAKYFEVQSEIKLICECDWRMKLAYHLAAAKLSGPVMEREHKRIASYLEKGMLKGQENPKFYSVETNSELWFVHRISDNVPNTTVFREYELLTCDHLLIPVDWRPLGEFHEGLF